MPPDPSVPPGCRSAVSPRRAHAARSDPRWREKVFPHGPSGIRADLSDRNPIPAFPPGDGIPAVPPNPRPNPHVPYGTTGRTAAASGSTCRKHAQGSGGPVCRPHRSRPRTAVPTAVIIPQGAAVDFYGPGRPEIGRPARKAVTSRTTLHHAAWGTSICLTVATSCSLSKPALISSKPILRSISRSTGSRP